MLWNRRALYCTQEIENMFWIRNEITDSIILKPNPEVCGKTHFLLLPIAISHVAYSTGTDVPIYLFPTLFLLSIADLPIKCIPQTCLALFFPNNFCLKQNTPILFCLFGCFDQYIHSICLQLEQKLHLRGCPISQCLPERWKGSFNQLKLGVGI